MIICENGHFIALNFSKCFVYSVDDIHMAAGFLTQLFPCVTGLGFGLQADMYNMIDIAVVKLKTDVTENDLKDDNVTVAQQLQATRQQNGNSSSNNEGQNNSINNNDGVQLTPDLQALVSQGLISYEAALGMM